ncbi:Kinase, NEK [Giardia duodenalis]|uniref:non-specific serine/threonine protein kinase n=1 Tax=Giardia intestinalis (strain ATCC 50803 / WB clone C6) TaxID=184922 RepID=A8BL00_GIAIC|nr:Kinase, NEK [Giardia intestinalis]KAE8301596.1 Kinase, NEK [Giardia intestinalis]|eukprot:XP_001706389.1 Kinase, NEK [Giardia lamblia ATCC 50803]
MRHSPKNEPLAHSYATVRVLWRDHRGTVSVVAHADTRTEFLCQEILYTRFSPRERRAIEADVSNIMDLVHPHVASVVDFLDDKDRETYYIISETGSFTTAGDLVRFSRNNNSFIPEETIWCIAAHILLGLSYCHLLCKPDPGSPSGILHRNIRPSSIIVVGEREYKLALFGVCHFRGNVVASQGTLSLYMAPEVVFHNAYSEKSDVWELGIVLYELCAKQRPFSGYDRQQIKDAIMNACIQSLPIYYSDELSAFICAMLKPDPSARSSVSTLLNHPKLTANLQDYDTTAKGYSPEQMQRLLELRTRELQLLKQSEAHLKTMLAQRSSELFTNLSASYMNAHSNSDAVTPTHLSTIQRPLRGTPIAWKMKGQQRLSQDVLASRFTELNRSVLEKSKELEILQKENMQLTDLISSQSQRYEDRLYEMQRSVTDLLMSFQCGDNAEGKTILMGAAESGFSYVVEQFISQQKRKQDVQGRTALMYAVLGGSLKCVRLLVREEARMVDSQGKTALAYAIANKDIELIRVLRDAEWNVVIHGNTSARDLALATQQEAIINLFPEDIFANNTFVQPRTMSAATTNQDHGHNSSNLVGEMYIGSKDLNPFSSQDDVNLSEPIANSGLDKVLDDNSRYLANLVKATKDKGEESGHQSQDSSYSYDYSYSSIASISQEEFLNGDSHTPL